MKKTLLILIYLISFAILSGCSSLFVFEEKSEEYNRLSEQYHNYLQKDIANNKNFQTFINQSTLESSLASVMIEVKVYNALGILSETRRGSGVVFYDYRTFYHILTVHELFNVLDEYTYTIDVIDYLGGIYEAKMIQDDPVLGLSAIRITKNSQHALFALPLARDNLMIKEPVILIGNQKQIINGMTLGLVTEHIEFNNEKFSYFKASITSDVYGNGGAIINTNHQIVGLQIEAGENQITAISHFQIFPFFIEYLNKLV